MHSTVLFPMLFLVVVIFLHAKAATALAGLNNRNSVCLSVRPSHRWISPKWCKAGFLNL